MTVRVRTVKHRTLIGCCDTWHVVYLKEVRSVKAKRIQYSEIFDLRLHSFQQLFPIQSSLNRVLCRIPHRTHSFEPILFPHFLSDFRFSCFVLKRMKRQMSLVTCRGLSCVIQKMLSLTNFLYYYYYSNESKHFIIFRPTNWIWDCIIPRTKSK